MITYFVYKMFIYDCLIEDLIFNGDCVEKAIGLVATPLFTIFGLLFILLDIIAIPLYLIIGILALIFKVIEFIKR